MATGTTNRSLTTQDAFKVPVRAATTADITLSAEQTIDTVAVVDGDRVLVKDQSSAEENGIYVASTGDWSRATDFNSGDELANGVAVNIAEGGQTMQLWALDTTGTITLDTTALSFTLLNSSTGITPYSWTGTTSGSQTDLVLDGNRAGTSENQFLVALSGVVQVPVTDYTLDTGTDTITLDAAAPDGITWLVLQLGQ